MLDLLDSTTNVGFTWLMAISLCQVISKLTDGRANHIPYRDSKLTRLLQSSLSGHGRVSVRLFIPYYLNEYYFKNIQRCFLDFISKIKHHSLFIHLCLYLQLICTVTPASSSSEETHNTLKFAHRAKHIEIQAAQNKAGFLYNRELIYF